MENDLVMSAGCAAGNHGDCNDPAAVCCECPCHAPATTYVCSMCNADNAAECRCHAYEAYEPMLSDAEHVRMFGTPAERRAADSLSTTE